MAGQHPFPDEAFTVQGGCFCTALRYTIDVPPKSQRAGKDVGKDVLPVSDIDHCDDCRRSAGSLIQFWFIVATPWLRWTALQKDGPDKEPLQFSVVDAAYPTARTAQTYMSHFATSEGVRRIFCGRCGTNLAYMAVENLPEMPTMDVTTGSIDREYLENEYFKLRPRFQGWWKSGIEWMQLWLLKGQEDDVKCSSNGNAVPGEVLNALLEKGRRGKIC